LGQDFRVTVLHADEVDRNHIPGLQAVQHADVLLLSIRRRVLPGPEMQILRDYVRSGKPVIALRTSSHAFSLRDSEVLGGNYHGSYPDELTSTVRSVPGGKTSPLLMNVPGLPFVQGGHMYKTGPLGPETSVVLEGVVVAGRWGQDVLRSARTSSRLPAARFRESFEECGLLGGGSSCPSGTRDNRRSAALAASDGSSSRGSNAFRRSGLVSLCAANS